MIRIGSQIFRKINFPAKLKQIVMNIHRNYGSDPPVDANSTNYIEEMYNAWLSDPSSVHTSWAAYFKSTTYCPPPCGPSPNPETSGLMNISQFASVCRASMSSLSNDREIDEYLDLQSIINAYQMRGHLVAELDPLGITNEPINMDLGFPRRGNVRVTRERFNFTIADMDRQFRVPPNTVIGGNCQYLTLRDIIQRLEQVYCGKIGIEFRHITQTEQVIWIRDRLETPDAMNFSNELKKLTLARLTRTTGFEGFLQKKFSSDKRFGLEGCEMMIPALKQIIDESSKLGIESIVMGMPHRGRLNVLANVCRKPLESILTQFASVEPTDSGSGDVKYHLGIFTERFNRKSNRNIRLSIVANPSHLEAVCPVVQGKVRAEQFFSGDSDGSKVMSILMHGDASNSGQGVVYETMHLADLPQYTTFGTIHLVINNQIGFTTDPRFSRSSPYCTDLGRVVNAPIFHVNADDPEAVIHVCNIAAAWRAEFHKDVVIDLIGYRRYGHNEIDEPMFTQPLMYQKIKSLKTCLQQYSQKLISEGVITDAEVKGISDEYEDICEKAFELAKTQTTMKFSDWLDSPWSGFFQGRDPDCIRPTGVKEKILEHIGRAFSTPPKHSDKFELHKGIQRILASRGELLASRMADWAMAEAFAFGSLLKEGIHVRLSGQDVERGTFSHRHHVYHHQKIDKALYRPLNYLYPDQAQYTVSNSSLSEYGVLGFELGYSVTSPNALVIWEAQFGDFANTAQCIIDQFISCGESKWVRQSGLVMYLPHGCEGMGAEHSSARLERFLQLSDDDPDISPPVCDDRYPLEQLRSTNWIVANCSTPANFFHIMRRQIALPFRKPLILATPKSLLRLPECRSSLDLFLPETEFLRLIPDEGCVNQVCKLIFCSGRTYYDLVKARDERELTEKYAISRIEQICPFPYDLFLEECEKYPDADIIWAQEEQKNQGSWPYLQPRIMTILNSLQRTVTYHGRETSASTAAGSKHLYKKEQAEYICGIFGPAPDPPKEVEGVKEKSKDEKPEKTS